MLSGNLNLSLMAFIAIWLAGYFTLADRGRSRARCVLIAFIVAIPLWWFALLVYRFLALFLFGTGAA